VNEDQLRQFIARGAAAQRAVVRAQREVRSALREISEEELQRQVCMYLALQWPELWRVTFHVPNGMAAKSRTSAARMQGIGMRAGVSDLISLQPRGRYTCLALELKRLGNKPTRTQYDFLAAVEQVGGCGRWADTFVKAREILDAYARLGPGQSLPSQ